MKVILAGLGQKLTISAPKSPANLTINPDSFKIDPNAVAQDRLLKVQEEFMHNNVLMSELSPLNQVNIKQMNARQILAFFSALTEKLKYTNEANFSDSKRGISYYLLKIKVAQDVITDAMKLPAIQPELPVEMMEKILLETGLDKKTLASMSCVNQFWNQRLKPNHAEKYPLFISSAILLKDAITNVVQGITTGPRLNPTATTFDRNTARDRAVAVRELKEYEHISSILDIVIQGNALRQNELSALKKHNDINIKLFCTAFKIQLNELLERHTIKTLFR